MRRSGIWVASAVWLSILLLIGLSLATPAAQAAPSTTAVCGAISANTTWTAANSPYEVCAGGAAVNAGITLTVQSGVTVQFVPGLINPRLLVQGALVALGTAEQPITFTSVVTAQVAGAWWGLTADNAVVTPAVVSLTYVTLDYGGTNAVSYGAQLYAGHATIRVSHSRLRSGQKNGLWSTGAGTVDIKDTSLTGNGGDALHLIQPATGLVLRGLTASGNGLNGVYVDNTTYLHGQQHWPAAGIPYIVNGVLGNFVGDSLTVDPGAELRFTANGYWNIAGDFKALGLPSAPITFTGQTKSPGFWNGLVLFGGQQPANAQLDYVTLEYGGRQINGANITIDNGYLSAQHSIIRLSAKDGVRLGSAAHAAILNSQIISNTLYGVRNTQITRAMLASNNWWGDPQGPTADVPTCSAGHGDKVTSGVLFRPVLTSTTNLNPLPLTNDPILTLTPRRWFAPADSTATVYFDINLVDGNGAPLPGRTVKLSSTLVGDVVTDGGVTDSSGHTLAYVVSHAAGDDNVTAALDVTGCEGALSPTAQISFTTPVNITDLFPDSPASYFDGNITVSPEPVAVGVPTLISARLANTLTVPITVDVSFGIAQSGINLTFGPIHDFNAQIIPAHGSLSLSTSWLPPISGHYCVQVTYSITGIGAAISLPAAGGGSGLKQHNLNVYQGSSGSGSKPGALNKTRNALDVLSGFFGNAFDTNHLTVQSAIVDKGIAWQLNSAEQIDGALHGDPPRQDYQQLAGPHKLVLPPVASGGGLSVARANALNALADALAEANADGAAAVIALDRSGGAAEAGNQQWQSLQSAAVIEYDRLMGQALITASARIDDLLNVAAGEGVTQVVISTSDVISFQQHLASGWSAQEIADAHAVGLTDAQLETLRKQFLDEIPKESLTGDGLQHLRDLRDQLLLLGEILLNPVAFQPHFSVGGSPGLTSPADSAVTASASGNTLAQLSATTTTLQVGNPVTATSPITVDLRTRRISLPADWTVSVSPAQVINLAPGAVTTVTVDILPGSPLPQGSLPQVSVEGYDHADSHLLGGVLVEVSVPNYVFFDGHLYLYLPLTQR